MTPDEIAQLRALASEARKGPTYAKPYVALIDALWENADALLDAAEEAERLRDWKASATESLIGWERVFAALGKPGPLGAYKSDSSLAEVQRLQAERDALRAELDALRGRVAGLADEWHRDAGLFTDEVADAVREFANDLRNLLDGPA